MSRRRNPIFLNLASKEGETQQTWDEFVNSISRLMSALARRDSSWQQIETTLPLGDCICSTVYTIAFAERASIAFLVGVLDWMQLQHTSKRLIHRICNSLEQQEAVAVTGATALTLAHLVKRGSFRLAYRRVRLHGAVRTTIEDALVAESYGLSRFHKTPTRQINFIAKIVAQPLWLFLYLVDLAFGARGNTEQKNRLISLAALSRDAIEDNIVLHTFSFLPGQLSIHNAKQQFSHQTEEITFNRLGSTRAVVKSSPYVHRYLRHMLTMKALSLRRRRAQANVEEAPQRSEPPRATVSYKSCTLLRLVITPPPLPRSVKMPEKKLNSRRARSAQVCAISRGKINRRRRTIDKGTRSFHTVVIVCPTETLEPSSRAMCDVLDMLNRSSLKRPANQKCSSTTRFFKGTKIVS